LPDARSTPAGGKKLQETNRLSLATMTRIILHAISALLLFVSIPARGQGQSSTTYGDNPAAGKYISINGVRHYYEVYGEGRPMLLIHGNGTGIKAWAGQIGYFSTKYKVYAIDCRGRGHSELGKDSLSYMQLAGDMAGFIQLMHLDSVSVVGRSDGGIIGIMMGIYFPEHISRIVAFGANMWPDSTALFAPSVAEVHNDRLHAEKMLAANDKSQNWYLVQQRNRMMEFQPHVTGAQLERIKVPVLVMSCDRDVIREEHTLFIYQHIPKANLCIFPGETHFITRENPQLFNTAVERFLWEPFRGEGLRFGK
jgi:pimeloyl-ACP methyl ester carboxylesterase